MHPGGVITRFGDCCFKNYTPMAVCSDKVSRTWLIESIDGLQPWMGAKIKLIESKDPARSVKLLAGIPSVSLKSIIVLKRIEI